MRLNKAEKSIIMLLGRSPGRARSDDDIERDSKANGIEDRALAQAYDSLEYREDGQRNCTSLIRQVGMGQSGNFGFELTDLGRQAFEELRGNL